MKTPSTLIPYIQYEIRYSNILNFTGWVRDIVNPFVKVATSISLDAPNSHRERIILNFDDEYMQMFVTWDRIIFKSEGDMNTMARLSLVRNPSAPAQGSSASMLIRIILT